MMDLYSEKFYKNFPDYFFAKLSIANLYLRKENYEAIQEIYGKKILLTQTFPNREFFHISEAIEFLMFLLQYALSKNSLESAVKHHLKMMELAPHSETTAVAKLLIEQYQENGSNTVLAYKKRFKPERSNKYKNYLESFKHDIVETYPELGISFELMPTVFKLYDRLNKMTKPNSSILVELEILDDKYPKIPLFKSMIIDYYGTVNDMISYAENSQLIYNKFPKYTFAVFYYADTILKLRDEKTGSSEYLNMLDKILPPELDLHEIFPQRKIISYQEFSSYEFLRLQIALEKKDLIKANHSLGLLSHFKIKNKHIEQFYWGKGLINKYIEAKRFKNIN